MDDCHYNGIEDLEKIGNKVQNIIEDAIDSQNYQKLSQTISQAVNNSIRQYQDGLEQGRREEARRQRRSDDRSQFTGPVSRRASERVCRPDFTRTGQVVESWETKPELYRNPNGQRVKHILKTVFGGILTGSAGICLLSVGLIQMIMGQYMIPFDIVMAALTGVGAGMLASGCSGLGRIGRYKKYVKALGTHTYVSLEMLSRAVQKPVKYVRRDIQKMISSGWFLEGHVDKQETCLITDHATYHQYEESQKQLEMRKEQEARLEQEKKVQEEAKRAAREKTAPEVQEVLDKGNEYLRKIRASNDAIPGEEISAKIDKMEQIVRRIFDRAEKHPEIIPDLKRLMDYYLPMTVKLLDAYEDMDKQPVQGENIVSAKTEIEQTLDTLNDAFARLLDSVFQDVAWDVSSDISVLHTMLAQEGLTGNDFTPENRSK